MQKCTYCGRENDDGASNCSECGTALTPVVEAEPGAKSPRRARGEQLMRRGVIWFAGGLAVTVLSYSAAIRSPYGGHYIVAYGAIIYGLAQFFRGRAAAMGTDTSDQARELLEIAAQL